jgi:hypothetical protein
MRTSSAKAKGRRACQEVVDLILSHFPELTDKDVFVTPSGVTGVDVQLSQRAFDILPLAIECKNTESLNIWKALEQAKSHVKGLETPILFFKRNRSELFVAFKAANFFKLYEQKKDNSHNL